MKITFKTRIEWATEVGHFIIIHLGNLTKMFKCLSNVQSIRSFIGTFNLEITIEIILNNDVTKCELFSWEPKMKEYFICLIFVQIKELGFYLFSKFGRRHFSNEIYFLKLKIFTPVSMFK